MYLQLCAFDAKEPPYHASIKTVIHVQVLVSKYVVIMWNHVGMIIIASFKDVF